MPPPTCSVPLLMVTLPPARAEAAVAGRRQGPAVDDGPAAIGVGPRQPQRAAVGLGQRAAAAHDSGNCHCLTRDDVDRPHCPTRRLPGSYRGKARGGLQNCRR